MERCYFCDEVVTQRQRSLHHLRPRRYFRKGAADFKGNVVVTHKDCHNAYHRQHDNPAWSFQEFLEMAKVNDFWKHVFC